VDVTEQTFETDVIERSEHEPGLVDFWAEWCGPCKRLTPVLEAAVEGRGVALAKVDVDSNKELAQRYGISGIPAVKAFRNGQVVAEFVGARSRQGRTSSSTGSPSPGGGDGR
jgi:putative thioredoxin